MGSEHEFLLRASEAGYTAVYVPSALVYHQIRPEQLTNSWICGRAFRLGRSGAYLNKSVPVLKVRRWMLREIATLFLYYIYYSIAGTEAKKLEHAIKFHEMRGILYQSYKGRRQSVGSSR
jgi:GT2 family glycosyltransferase